MARMTRIFAALSELTNAAIGGHNNETLSGRAYRTKSKYVPIINSIFFWQVNHCKTSHEDDIEWAKEFLSEAKDITRKRNNMYEVNK